MKTNENHGPILRLICFLLFIGTIIILANCDALNLMILKRIPHSDWIGHFVLYGLMYLFLLSPLGERRGLIISLSFASLEEISQLFLIHRTFSFIDLLMGVLGIILSQQYMKFASLRISQ